MTGIRLAVVTGLTSDGSPRRPSVLRVDGVLAIQDQVWSTLVLIGGIGLMILIGVIAVLAVIVAAQAKERREADKVLALRLAKGEISEAEYERLFMLLRFGPGIELSPDLQRASREGLESPHA